MSQKKRVAISKRVRFEVFKRDSFKCQYCGKSAPDVILHVDHIELTEIAKSSKNWSDWQSMMDDAIKSSISYGGGNV